MDGPRDDHTKRSQIEKTNMIPLICKILKKWYKWIYLKNRNRLHLKTNFWLPKGKGSGSLGLNYTCYYIYDLPRQHIKKQRQCFVNKVLSSQDYGFSSSHVWMWELDYKESWALKNWCFWTMVPWTARKSKKSILKEISPGYSLEGLMSRLKLQYFGYLMQRADSFEKTLILGKIEAGGEGANRG